MSIIGSYFVCRKWPLAFAKVLMDYCRQIRQRICKQNYFGTSKRHKKKKMEVVEEILLFKKKKKNFFVSAKKKLYYLFKCGILGHTFLIQSTICTVICQTAAVQQSAVVQCSITTYRKCTSFKKYTCYLLITGPGPPQ